MRRRKRGFGKRIGSISLAIALVITSLQVTVNPQTVKRAEAASESATLDDAQNLDGAVVKDDNIQVLYRIYSNAVKKKNAGDSALYNEIKEMKAGAIKTKYAATYGTEAKAQPILEYDGVIDFSDWKEPITTVQGIGWARAAQKIILDGATFASDLTAVPADEFAKCSAVEIDLPSTVTKVESRAFELCKNLKTLKIGQTQENVVDLSNVTEIGASAFRGCSSIPEVIFKDSSNLIIGESAFGSCESITEVDIPVGNADHLGAHAFDGCIRLGKVTLQDSLTYLSNSLFQQVGTSAGGAEFYVDGTAESGRLPSNLTYIGNGCFQGAYLKSLDLKSCTKLTEIRDGAFSASARFDSNGSGLVLPDSLLKIGEDAFNMCRLNKIVIPDKCADIGKNAFYLCHIEEIVLPACIEEIKESTFERCEYLLGEKITIKSGSKLKKIGMRAFSGCNSLGTTSFLKNLTELETIDERAFYQCYYFVGGSTPKKNGYGDNLLLCGLEEIILPDSVQSLGTEVFAENYALRTANLGAGVAHIPDKAFYNSIAANSGAGLETVIVSGKLQSIGEEAFANQSRLHTVGYKDGNTIEKKEGVAKFKDGLLSIGTKAFFGCGVQSKFSVSGGAAVYVPKGSVKTEAASGLVKFLIYDYDNAGKKDNYCKIGYLNPSGIKTAAEFLVEGGPDIEDYELVYLVAQMVYIAPGDVKESGDINFNTDSDYDLNRYLQVYDEYSTTDTAYQNRLFTREAQRNLYIKKAADGEPDPVKKEAGSGLDGYWIKVNGNPKYAAVDVGKTSNRNFTLDYAFGLEDVIIPDSVQGDKLGERAFEKCVNLNEVTLSQNLTEIKDGTFSGCSAEVINALSTTEKDKYNDFYGLRTILIPNSVKKIGKEAFARCYNLLLKTTGSAFGNGVEEIGDKAFVTCVSLERIGFPSSLKTIGQEAFAGCAMQYKDPRKIPYTNGKEYSYIQNAKQYGTKEIKKGLNEIDFTTATGLTTVGAGAFKQTNVVAVNMTNSPLVDIPDSLFEMCTYLKNISFQNKTESLGSNVLKDTESLTTIRIPALAKVKKNTISGAFGKFAGYANPTLNLDGAPDEIITIPMGRSIRLPINAINKDTMYGSVKISVNTGNGYQAILNTEENPQDASDIPVEEVAGISAEFNTEDDPYSFILYGNQTLNEPVKVRVQTATRFQQAESDSFMDTPHVLEYQVNVKEQPTEKITLSVDENEANLKKNPSMYDGEKKILYIPFGKEASKNGVALTALLEPAETTEGVVWTSSSDVVTIENAVTDNGDLVRGTDGAVATALIKTIEIGSAEIKVTSGNKTDTIQVYSVIPVVGSNGITCTTGGNSLGANLTPNSASNPYGLAIGDSEKLEISMNYGNTDYTEEQLAAYGEKYKFESDNPSVISVTSDGTIKAEAEGKATITVTALGSGANVKFYFDVSDEVNYTPSSVEVSGEKIVVNEKNEKTADLNVGETLKLSAVVAPSKASQEVTWEVTSGKDVISVDEKGVVTALKKGTGKVLAAAKEKSAVKSKEVTINVLAPATGLRILNGDITLEIGKTLQISKSTKETDTKGFYITPIDTTDTITWSSSNEAVVSVANANTQSVTIKAVAAGTAVLTGTTSSGISASITVTVPVPQIKVNGITIDKEVTLNVGGVHQLNPQLTPANANESVTFTYTSSKAEVATVDANGLIRAVAPGSVSIQAKTSTGKTANCNVTVKSPAKKVTLLVNKPSFKKIYMAKGQTVALKAKVTPENTTDTITWKSNKAKIAAVNASGTVTAKKKGTAKITATTTSKKKATITVIVQKKQVKAKKVTLKAKKTMKRGKTIRVTPALKSAKSTDTVSFASNKPAIAKVDAYGYVTGLKKGKVKITVTASSGKKATKTIKVK